MKIGDEIQATYQTGGGVIIEEGLFIIAKITKTFMFLKMIEEGHFAQYPNWKIRKIPIRDFKARKEPMPKWVDDDYFCCYHYRTGTPTSYQAIDKHFERGLYDL